MSLFSKGLKWAAGAADKWLGTGSMISTAYSTVEGFVQKGVTLAKDTGLDKYVQQAYGQNQTTFKAPEYTPGTAHKSVSTTAGSFQASRVANEMAKTGMTNSNVRAAWKKASANPRIAAQIDIVRPTTAKKGVTKSLKEAKIG